MGPLVTVDWLSERVSDVVVLDATLPPVGVTPVIDTRARYVERHLPGAVFFDIEELSDHTSGLPHTMPTAEAFGSAMQELGVGRDATIVVYEQAGVFSAARAWWMLRAFGAKRVYVLDGRLTAWVDAGLPTERGEVLLQTAEFKPKQPGGTVKCFSDVQAMISAGGQILDARSAGRFEGTAPEPRAGLSSGHMPGAVSVPFSELARDGRMKPAEEIAGIFAAKGVDLRQPVTTTCGSGVTAAVVALGLEMVGAGDVSLYDGSWAEYASRPDAVIVKG